MAYRMNGIPQIGGDGDAKKKLNTPYDSLKAGVGRKYLDADGEKLFDRPMKLDEARSKIKTGDYWHKKTTLKSRKNLNYFGDINKEVFDLGSDGSLFNSSYMYGVAQITKDDEDGFYWYGKHHSIPKKQTRKPTPKMDKISTKGIAKGKKVEAKIKNAPKPKVKYNLYSSASQLAKQNKAVGYTETKLPGASKVLRRNMSANEYKNK